jgi:hypothetical protein
MDISGIDFGKLLSDVEKLKSDASPAVADIRAVIVDIGLADRVNAILDWIEHNGGFRVADNIKID